MTSCLLKHHLQTLQSIASEYTLGRFVVEDRYHNEVVRSQLTRNIAGLFDEITDEISTAYSENVVLEGNGEFLIPTNPEANR